MREITVIVVNGVIMIVFILAFFTDIFKKK